jgi:1,4-dihydroxy-2-naphthoate octaprenyltransferase
MLLWMYSAPPFGLMSRGALGEIAIALSWSLVVIGYSTLQLGTVDIEIVPIAIAYGLMVANILFLNQIPDINADISSQKMTLAAQSKLKHLWLWYSTFPVCAYLLQIFAVRQDFVPPQSMATILVIPIFWFCAIKLKRSEIDQSHLKMMIPINILGVHLYALLISLGFILNARAPF